MHDVLSEVILADHKEPDHSFLPVIVGFSRHLAEDVAGFIPRKNKLLLSKYGLEPPETQVRRGKEREEVECLPIIISFYLMINALCSVKLCYHITRL